MAKKNAVQLSPEETIKVLANEYKALNQQKKEIDTRLEALKSDLCEYARNNPGFDFGSVQVIQGAAKFKFDWGNLTKKAQDQILAQLAVELPQVVVRSEKVDIELIAQAIDHDASVRNALAAKGLKLISSDTFTIRINNN